MGSAGGIILYFIRVLYMHLLVYLRHLSLFPLFCSFPLTFCFFRTYTNILSRTCKILVVEALLTTLCHYVNEF